MELAVAVVYLQFDFEFQVQNAMLESCVRCICEIISHTKSTKR